MFYLKQISLWAVVLFLLSCGNNTGTKELAPDSTDTETTQEVDLVDSKDSLPPDLYNLRFCTEKLPYPHRQFKKLYQVDSLLQRDEHQKINTILKAKEGQERAYIISLNGYVWNKNILQIKFLNGNKSVQSKVQQAVKEWERACAVRFVYGDFPDPDITISFQDAGYWSNIGSDSKGRIPSMSLTGLSANMSDIEFNGVVLHEFGHALGFVHEHQSPAFNIPWDTDRVERYYKIEYGWSSQKIYDEIIYKYEFPQVNGTAFDPNSIMVYAIPKGLMIDRSYFIDWPHTLSKNDKKVAAERYH